MTTPSTTSDISGRIVDALALSDPELDTSIGTPLRKIIDAVSAQISNATTNSYLTTYGYDIDSMSGGDLDDFCANFGLARIPGSRAIGTLTFSRSSTIAANSSVVIPPGTQAITGTIPPQTFVTTVSTTLDVGQTSVDIPAQAVLEGPDANILANTPLQMGTTVTGITTVSNTNAFIGGSIDETDAQLISRFKSTVFRNLAGTDQMYRGIALQTLANQNQGSFGVAQVNILGATTHNSEQIQISSGTASSSLTTAAYIITSSIVISDSSGNIYTPQNQYTSTANNSVSPATLVINSLGASVGMPDGIYDLEYDYIPISSRNDPFNTRWNQGVVNNRVDVIVNGQVPVGAVQAAAYVNTITFNNTAGSSLQASKFVSPSGSNPQVGDVFIPLGFGPILSLPSTFVINSVTYTLGTNYDIIHDDSPFGYTPSSLFGIWWKTTTNATNPPNNTQFTVSYNTTQNSDGSTTTTGYTYNSVPSSVQSDIANWRLLGTDVQIHAGKQALLLFNLAIIYGKNVVASTVNSNINSALTSFLQTQGFNASVEIVDIVQTVRNVQGVDNVRLLTSSDNPTNYAVQLVHSSGSVISTYETGGLPTDLYFDERTYPVFYGANITARARNTFGAL